MKHELQKNFIFRKKMLTLQANNGKNNYDTYHSVYSLPAYGKCV